MSRSARAYGFALLSFVLYSSHDAIIKALGAEIPVVQIMFFGSTFSLVFMVGFVLVTKTRINFRPRHPWLMLFRVALTIITQGAAFYAFTLLPFSEVYALLFITPLLITAWSVPLLGEHVGLPRWVAVFVGLAGVLVVLRPGIEALSLGHFAALTSALGASLAMIIVRKVSNVEERMVVIFYPLLASTLLMGALLPAVYVPMSTVITGGLMSVGALFFLAQLCVIAAYRMAPSVALIAPVQYTQLIWAAIFGALFFDEYPDIWVLVGAAIIIGSGLFVLSRENMASGEMTK